MAEHRVRAGEAQWDRIELTKVVGDEEEAPVRQVLRFSDGQEIVF